MFHEHKTIEDMEKNVSGVKLTYKGVADVTHGQTSSERATNEAEMFELEPRAELKEPFIKEEKSCDDNDMRSVDQEE